LILTIDLSTSICRIYVFNCDGKIICSNQKSYNVKSQQKDWVELDPESVWSVVCANIKTVLRKIDNKKIVGIGITAQLGMCPVDAQGNALAPILTWMDQRAKNQAGKIEQDIGNKNIYRLSGRRVNPELNAPRMLWFKENCPQVYDRTSKFLSLKDYIITKFTGKFGIDPTHASYTMLYNIKKRKWDRDLIHDLGLDKEKLPMVYESKIIIGTVNRESSIATGLKEDTPIVVGGPDGSVGALGAGLIKPGVAVNMVGTTDVFFTCTDKPVFDDKIRTVVNCHLIPGLWSVGGPMSMTGGCLQWFMSEFGESEREVAKRTGCSAYDLFDQEAVNIEAGAENLLFFTSLVGDRTPNWNPNIRGSILGLSPKHKKEHLIRAIFEGSSFAVKQLINIVEELGIEINDIIMIGGGSRSPVWQQIRADVTGKNYLVHKNREATAFGVYMTVAVGIGIYNNYFEAVSKLINIKSNCCFPNANKHLKYQKLYEKYLRIYNFLQKIYKI